MEKGGTPASLTWEPLGHYKKRNVRYCGIIFHARRENKLKKPCFPMGIHINRLVAFQAAANSTKTNRTMLDSARDLYVRSSMSEIDYQAAVTGHRWPMNGSDGWIVTCGCRERQNKKTEQADQQMDR